MPSQFTLIWLRALDRLAVGVKVAVQTLPSAVACLRLLRLPLAPAITMELSPKPGTVSLKVNVTVAVSPAVRRSLSIVTVTVGARASISKLLLVGLTATALPALSRMVLRLNRRTVLVAPSASAATVLVRGGTGTDMDVAEIDVVCRKAGDFLVEGDGNGDQSVIVARGRDECNDDG